MTDTSGIIVRYTCKQRRFEGKLPRHLRVLEKEKAETDGLLQAERDMSKHLRKTNRHGRFLAYLAEKKIHDERTSPFYLEEKWRGWKFRLSCKRKKSEDLFLNRVEEKYGKDCVLHCGDWSRKDQMNGCAPSLGMGWRKCCKRSLTEVDEFNTSKTCNIHFGEMSGHVKRDGRRSYSRLSCWNCAGRYKNRSKRFADRYLNVAANVLLIGTCKQRPLVFARSRKRKGSEEESVSHKKTKLSVDVERTLSDDVPFTSWRCQRVNACNKNIGIENSANDCFEVIIEMSNRQPL